MITGGSWYRGFNDLINNLNSGFSTTETSDILSAMKKLKSYHLVCITYYILVTSYMYLKTLQFTWKIHLILELKHFEV